MKNNNKRPPGAVILVKKDGSNVTGAMDAGVVLTALTILMATCVRNGNSVPTRITNVSATRSQLL